MAEEESLELTTENQPKSKKKLIIFIVIGVVLVALIAGAVLFFMGGGDEESIPATPGTAASTETVVDESKKGKANYVGMPRPFLFNLPGVDRARLVEIKVQLMVRGDDGQTAKMHIPLIEDALLTTFSAADVQKLSTQAGKDELRQLALLNVQNTLQPVAGRKIVEKVLFTGFVMQ